MCHEYLVLCKGRPWRSVDFTMVQRSRMDALSRIARAVLASSRDVHFLFDDATLVSLAANFLGRGKPWGPTPDEASEMRFRELFSDILHGIVIPGATLREGALHSREIRRARRSSIDAVLGHGAVSTFEQVIMLREDGNLLQLLRPSKASKALAMPRVLFVIGGVRDVSSDEEAAMRESCERLAVPFNIFGLGCGPELTSKIIKGLEVAYSYGSLAEALHNAAIAPHERACKMIDTQDITRAPLHVIILVDTSVPDFVTRPTTATLLVDHFRASHYAHKRATLSFLDCEGQALTVRGEGKIMDESDAFEYLRSNLKRMRRATLQMLFSVHQSDSRVVLHADSSAPPLRRPSRSAADISTPVTVVFGSPTLAEIVQTACKRSGIPIRGGCARASVGGALLGPAFVGMLHSEGLLAPAARLAALVPSQPTRVRAHRLTTEKLQSVGTAWGDRRRDVEADGGVQSASTTVSDGGGEDEDGLFDSKGTEANTLQPQSASPSSPGPNTSRAVAGCGSASKPLRASWADVARRSATPREDQGADEVVLDDVEASPAAAKRLPTPPWRRKPKATAAPGHQPEGEGMEPHASPETEARAADSQMGSEAMSPPWRRSASVRHAQPEEAPEVVPPFAADAASILPQSLDCARQGAPEVEEPDHPQDFEELCEDGPNEIQYVSDEKVRDKVGDLCEERGEVEDADRESSNSAKDSISCGAEEVPKHKEEQSKLAKAQARPRSWVDLFRSNALAESTPLDEGPDVIAEEVLSPDAISDSSEGFETATDSDSMSGGEVEHLAAEAGDLATVISVEASVRKEDNMQASGPADTGSADCLTEEECHNTSVSVVPGQIVATDPPDVAEDLPSISTLKHSEEVNSQHELQSNHCVLEPAQPLQAPTPPVAPAPARSWADLVRGTPGREPAPDDVDAKLGSPPATPGWESIDISADAIWDEVHPHREDCDEADAGAKLGSESAGVTSTSSLSRRRPLLL